MERVVARENMLAALKRVERNGGAPGIDGIPTEQLRDQIRAEWNRIREELLAGTYRPKPVRQVEIPKPSGGMRKLGIPTVLDRLIQQAILQVLQPIFDPTFSRAQLRLPAGAQRARRGAAGAAVRPGRARLGGGRGPGEVLRPREPRRADGDGWRSGSTDKRVLRLIRRYLEAGIMANGVVMERRRGYAARRTALAAAGQRAARRSGQGAGEARARVRPLRRRLQRVRASRSGRASG